MIQQKYVLVDAGVLRSIKPSMTMREVFERLGKPEKDTGSGINILQWRGSDGSILYVGTGDLRPEAKPLYVILQPSPRKEKP
jgi:hypothetical protein